LFCRPVCAASPLVLILSFFGDAPSALLLVEASCDTQ
jgi:hypothetical protein